MYTVYALYSPSYHKIYIGYSSDIAQRLVSHNHPKNKGWTARYQPWILVFQENFESKLEAMRREKELKSFKGREFIWILVKDYLETHR